MSEFNANANDGTEARSEPNNDGAPMVYGGLKSSSYADSDQKSFAENQEHSLKRTAIIAIVLFVFGIILG